MPHAAVIGSGFGGLAAALRLRAKGYEVTVIEKQPQLGGKATTISSNGFHYDAGPTVITAHFLIDELFELFGKDRKSVLPFFPVVPWYCYAMANGALFKYGPTTEATKEEIARLYPKESKGYERYLLHSKALFNIGYEEYGCKPFDRLSTFAGCLPSFIRLGAFRNCVNVLGGFFSNQQLIEALAIPPLLVGGNPYSTPSIYLLIHHLENQWGVHYPHGGTAALIKALVDLGREQGIRYYSSSEATALRWEGSRVRAVETSRTGAIEVDHVVFNGDPSNAYRTLIPNSRHHWTTKLRSRNVKQGMGLFVLYFSTKGRYTEVPHHTIVLTDRFKDHIDGVFKRGMLEDKPNIYLHRPTATDPSAAPEGYDSFYALIPVPNLRSPIDWEAVKGSYGDKILDQLEKKMMPNLKNNLVDLHIRTPNDFAVGQNCFEGSPFTLQPTLDQSAYFRYGHRLPEADNLFFVGAGTHPGAGIPGVLTSAKVLDSYL